MTKSFDSFCEPIRSNEALHSHAVYKTFDAKTTILNENDQGGAVYFILEGQVNVTGYSARGREIWYSKLGAGHIFGEMAALQDGLRTASVTAVEPTTTAIIPKAVFLSILEKYPEVSLWLLKELVQRLDNTTHQLYARVALNMSARLCAHVLVRCADRPNADGEYQVAPNLVLAQLARQLNTDRENISRAISDLVKDGVVRREGRQLFVINKTALENRTED